MAIRTFSDQMAADVFAGLNSKFSRRLPQRVWSSARRKMDGLHAAAKPADLTALQVEALTKTKPGFLSIRINDQYRLIFRFENGDAHDVYIEGQDHTGRR